MRRQSNVIYGRKDKTQRIDPGSPTSNDRARETNRENEAGKFPK